MGWRAYGEPAGPRGNVMKAKHLIGYYSAGYQLQASTTQLDVDAGAYIHTQGNRRLHARR